MVGKLPVPWLICLLRQVQGDLMALNGRSDTFSLGVIFYELLTKRRPFDGTSVDEIKEAILSGQFEPIRSINSAVPRWLANGCQQLLENDPERRPTAANSVFP